MSFKILRFFLLFLVFSLLSVNCSGDDDSGSMDKLAAALRPLPRTWSTNSSSYCKWHGVKCASSMHVIEIDLNDMALSDSLPSEFPPFPYLQVLRLSRNKLTGPLPRFDAWPESISGTWMIPLEFTKFRNLSVFSAYNTNLEGSIPDIFDSLA
ncbi:hypothetical protein F3Y22_tig00111070pilonHSYRG00076 [Hibiscus syriacus]|uniref:Leucine-rich repeat-containing N-terminal plant-type domain-containing protein n=1 Tax=Hibiscus syriacus TaxID=106335 RepID=A0A6A2Z330_HIBSY|nr:hypothetical protein F3Y22_tig00111070pilonHSYRG00076 [Hibiscus syriacus]